MPDRWEAGRGEGVEAGRRPNTLLTGQGGGMSQMLVHHKSEATCTGPPGGGQGGVRTPQVLFLSRTCFPIHPTPSLTWHPFAAKNPRVFMFLDPSPSMPTPQNRLSPKTTKTNFWPAVGDGREICGGGPLPGSPLNYILYVSSAYR